MSDAVRRFYGSRARLYDILATHTPGVGSWRRAAVDSLALSEGDTVVAMGCGTGASLPLLSAAVGATGTVIGLDLTPELLMRARRRTTSLENVSIVRGDAGRPPISGPVDGVVACFVVGLLSDPELAVNRWCRLVGPSGRVALLDGVPTGWAHPLDRVFASLVRLGAPPTARKNTLDRLARRVGTAHGLLRVSGEDSRTKTFALGFVRLTDALGDAAATGPGIHNADH
jgi:phosphatidylethanolamine/phosphatidyl-N-methylethanolamine N-methyltransferase